MSLRNNHVSKVIVRCGVDTSYGMTARLACTLPNKGTGATAALSSFLTGPED